MLLVWSAWPVGSGCTCVVFALMQCIFAFHITHWVKPSVRRINIPGSSTGDHKREHLQRCVVAGVCAGSFAEGK